MEPREPLSWNEAHDIHDRIEKAVGTGPEGSYAENETLWWRLKVGDVLELPGFGVAEVVDSFDDGDFGDFECFTQPIYFVFKVETAAWTRHFQVVGKNVSHEGAVWDYPQFREVFEQPRQMREWKRAAS